jgi:hypothetical protein
MYREAVSASTAATGMEISHHRTAALYFGIAALECILNREMTRHQSRLGRGHDEINDLLRRPKFKIKLEKWPEEITGRPLQLRPETIGRILEAHDLRGQLTHLKNYWPNAYDELRETNTMELVERVAEFIIAFHLAKGELFPYWVWGWNYLSPGRTGHELALLPNSQVIHSLRALAYPFERRVAYGDSGQHQRDLMGSFDAYVKVAQFLASSPCCEPKTERFPHQPKLCQRWWDPAHQISCGGVTPQALARALELDEEYTRKRRNVPPSSGAGKAKSTEKAVQRILNWSRRVFR